MKRALAVGASVALAGIAAFAACGGPGGSECFYANMCLDKCCGTVVKSGCGVQCDPPLVERMQCSTPDAPDDVPNLIQDTGVETGGDAKSDSAADAPGG